MTEILNDLICAPVSFDDETATDETKERLRQLFLRETMVLPQSGDVLPEPDVLHGFSSVFL